MNIKKLFFNNFSLKVFSLFLAFTVWVLITGRARSNIERFINIDVEFINVISNANISAKPDKIRIKIRGTSNEIKAVSPKDFSLVIDLKDVRDGARNYFTRDFLVTEKSELITSVHPTMIEVNVREIIQRTVPVKAKFYRMKNNKKMIYRQERIGEIGYTFQIRPDRVTIEGYKPDIYSIPHVYIQNNIQLPEDDINKVVRDTIQNEQEIIRIIGNNEIEVTVGKKQKTPRQNKAADKNESKSK